MSLLSVDPRLWMPLTPLTQVVDWFSGVFLGRGAGRKTAPTRKDPPDSQTFPGTMARELTSSCLKIGLPPPATPIFDLELKHMHNFRGVRLSSEMLPQFPF